MTSHLTYAKPCISTRSNALAGNITVPGDKSISHRSLLLGSQIIGSVTIRGLLMGDDVMCTKAALAHLGVTITQTTHDEWQVQGVGIGGLRESSQPLDMGNSGTGARLLMGLVSSYPFTSFFYGDESLSSRPMNRVIIPLSQSGAQFVSRTGGRLPLSVTGRSSMLPIEYELPVASAQVKSAVLLAGLNIPGRTTVVEPVATRDHTERMLQHLGIAVERDGTSISIMGQQAQSHQDIVIDVPGDPSSAAFPIVAALLVPGSEITIRHICMNPLRTGLFTILQRMGADIEIRNERQSAGEPVADLTVRSSALKAVDVEADIAPSMIDEYPVLAVACAFASGESRMRGLSELRVKESDRLQAVIDGLNACGVEAYAEGDDLIVKGMAGTVEGGGTVTTHFDHRIAMSFLVMGLATEKPVMVDDSTAISTSFPRFINLMTGLGAFITEERRSMRRISRDKPLVVAIDGPAASGKGTLARRLAERLDLPYLDTGMLYRAVGMKLVYSDQDPGNKASAIAAAQSISAQDFTNPRLRQERVGQAASIISAMPEVRAILLDFQRNFAAAPHGAVLDGRDIGTVVCPQADLKLFITASIDTRAARRHRELQGEGIEVVYESVLADLVERDARDSQRKNAPLVAADDAIRLDTSDMTANEVFTQVLRLLNEKLDMEAA